MISTKSRSPTGVIGWVKEESSEILSEKNLTLTSFTEQELNGSSWENSRSETIRSLIYHTKFYLWQNTFKPRTKEQSRIVTDSEVQLLVNEQWTSQSLAETSSIYLQGFDFTLAQAFVIISQSRELGVWPRGSHGPPTDSAVFEHTK